ncbi:Ribonuclease Z [Acropora cervicornis]|uniref:ribonuclease Z n=1 Tax=Acropora cervicornis TaxID=6130 RepID=A0AAD9QA45_ACRCE|nr:Ribonuclease Z [Acropora cervicornis]
MTENVSYPVGNACSLMAIMIRIHHLTFVEIFKSFNDGLISKFKGRVKNANESKQLKSLGEFGLFVNQSQDGKTKKVNHNIVASSLAPNETARQMTSLRQGHGFLRTIHKQKRCQFRWHWCGRHAGKGKLVSTRSYLQILGTSTDYSSPSFLLFTDSYRYLFNCGENTVRILHELDRLKMNISRVFLTGMTWQNHIAGLPTLLKRQATINGGPLLIYGPEGISKFLDDISTFSSTGLQRYDALKLFTSTEFVKNNTDEQEERYVDDNLSIMPVILERKYQDVSYSERQSICYICEFADLPGHFLHEKAVKLGVSEEHFNELALGNQVLSSCGQKVP